MALTLLTGCKTGTATKPRAAVPLAAPDAARLGTEAYIYGYPLVTMELARRVVTNVREPEESRAPMGQFARLRRFPDASSREVTAQNTDLLYCFSWLDVGREPWVLSLPEANGRYYLMPMLDGWT